MATISKNVKKGTVASFKSWGLMTAGLYRARVKTLTRTRTGKLSQSFKFVATGKGADTEGKFFSNSKYAHIQEYGSRKPIRPVRRKFLAIPIEGSPAMTSAGVSRYAFSLRDTLPRASFWFWFVGNSSGGFLMGRRKVAGSKAVAWFRLVKQVKIKPRLKFREYIRDAVRKFRDQLARAAQEAINGR